MTHYTTSYKDLKDGPKQIKAIQDIIDYLGEDKFAELTALAREEKRKGLILEQFAFQVSFAGIEGYPVGVWWAMLDSEGWG